jgi:uncharacterized membrane protein
MKELFEVIVVYVETAAVTMLFLGLAISTGRFLFGVARGLAETAYRKYRRELGRTLQLTLEFLIAADIIDTVAVEKTYTSLGMLGGLVLIRTFLSFALELEVTGRWPWQGREGAAAEN